MERSRLAILIPALNEAATIGDVVARSLSFGDVIVIDDGSTDNTATVAHIAGAAVVTNPGPRGYDRAIETGFAAAEKRGYEWVVTMDADGEHNPDVLASFRTALVEQRVPLVIGRRPRPRRATEALMAWYFRWRFGIHDPLCGMKGYNLDLYRENNGFDHFDSIGTELAFNSARRGHQFREVGVSGGVRVDVPRFGRTLKANYRIGKALLRLIALDVGAALEGQKNNTSI